MFSEGIAENVFQTAIRLAGLVVLSPAGRLSQIHPIGGFVTRPAKTALRIHKGLQENDLMIVKPLPVPAEPSCAQAQQMRGKVGNLDPGQDQKPGVGRNERNVFLPLFFVPTDMQVPAPNMARGRAPADAGHGAIMGIGDIFYVFTDLERGQCILRSRNQQR